MITTAYTINTDGSCVCVSLCIYVRAVDLIHVCIAFFSTKAKGFIIQTVSKLFYHKNKTIYHNHARLQQKIMTKINNMEMISRILMNTTYLRNICIKNNKKLNTEYVKKVFLK